MKRPALLGHDGNATSAVGGSCDLLFPDVAVLAALFWVVDFFGGGCVSRGASGGGGE